MSYLDIGANADKLVQIQVDGQTVEVPLAEALAGYSRQEDYTKKTQEIAEQRKQLESLTADQRNAMAIYERLRADPEATVTALQQELGITTAPPAADPLGQEDDVDPEIKALRDNQVALETQIRQLTQNQTIDSETKKLLDAYPDANVEEVIQFAREKRLPEGSLDLAYRAMMFDKQAEESAKTPDDPATEGMSDGISADFAELLKRQIPQAPASRASDGNNDLPSTGDAFLDAVRAADMELRN